jgi:hypothetical protein
LNYGAAEAQAPELAAVNNQYSQAVLAHTLEKQ